MSTDSQIKRSSKQRRPVDFQEIDFDFLCKIPRHWKWERLKNVANVKFSSVDKKSEDGETAVRLCNYTDVYNHDAITEDMDFMQATATQSEIERFTLKKADVIITKDSESWNDIAVPAYVTKDLPGVLCGYHLALIRPKPDLLEGAYLSRVFESDGIRQQFHIAANGITRYGLPNRSIAGASIPLPPLDEQRAIADFLDRETAKIDALIAKKERLIELLKEKRQSVISRAITKGLDPNISMKSSGINWLGDVPEGWQIVSMKHLVRQRIIDGPHETPQKLDEGVPFVSAEALSQGFIDFNKKWGYISSEDHNRYSKRYKPQFGDILLVKLGATTGTPAIVDTEIDFNIWVPLAAIRLKKSVHPKFIFYVLQSHNLRVAYELSWTYGTQQTLGLATISNLHVPVPSLSELHRIANLLDDETSRIGALAVKICNGIDHYRQYRSALITAAVTGQIDVRKYRGEVPE